MIYQGTHDMPIYHFWKCLVKDDMRYMVVGWNERDEIKIPEDADEKFFDVFNEYCMKTANNETDTYYALLNEIDYMKRRYNILAILVGELNEENKEAYGNEIQLWGFRFDLKKTVAEQIKNFEKQFRAARQDIELKEDELKKLTGETDEGEPLNLYKKKIRLERILGISIELKATVIDEWIEIESEAKEVNEEIKRQLTKQKDG